MLRLLNNALVFCLVYTKFGQDYVVFVFIFIKEILFCI